MIYILAALFACQIYIVFILFEISKVLVSQAAASEARHRQLIEFVWHHKGK
jgi:hypothetical protein